MLKFRGGKVQGYYIEKKLIGQADRYEDMSMEELDAEMKKIDDEVRATTS